MIVRSLKGCYWTNGLVRDLSVKFKNIDVLNYKQSYSEENNENKVLRVDRNVQKKIEKPERLFKILVKRFFIYFSFRVTLKMTQIQFKFIIKTFLK